MTEGMKYHVSQRCEKCKCDTRHVWQGSGEVGKGEWLCVACRIADQFGEDLADIIKAATRRLDTDDDREPIAEGDARYYRQPGAKDQ